MQARRKGGRVVADHIPLAAKGFCLGRDQLTDDGLPVDGDFILVFSGGNCLSQDGTDCPVPESRR